MKQAYHSMKTIKNYKRQKANLNYRSIRNKGV